MSVDMIADGRYLPKPLEEWGIQAHWVLAPDGTPYLAIARQCAELGIAFQSQMAKLAADDSLAEGALLPFVIETKGGRQATKCLRRAEAAIWLAGIHPSKVAKVELRAKLAQIRRDILAAADRIVFGDYTGVLTVSSTPPRGGDLDVGCCPRCRARLSLHAGPDGFGLSVSD